MERHQQLLNRFLVDVFYEILRTEELCISRAGVDHLSLKELHVIDAVCRAEDEGWDNRATTIARALGVTSGTLTVAVSLLEKKGYLIRQKDPSDKRLVRIRSTDQGRTISKYHEEFHKEMVQAVREALTDEELEVFLKGLQSVGSFFEAKNKLITGGHS